MTCPTNAEALNSRSLPRWVHSVRAGIVSVFAPAAGGSGSWTMLGVFASLSGNVRRTGARRALWRRTPTVLQSSQAFSTATVLATTIASCAPEVDPERQARLVSELRKNLAEQRLLMAEQQADQRRSGPSEGPLSASSVFSVALVAFAIVALSVVAALARSAPAVRVDLHRDGRGRLCAPGRHDRGAAAAPGPDTRGEDRRGDRQ